MTIFHFIYKICNFFLLLFIECNDLVLLQFFSWKQCIFSGIRKMSEKYRKISIHQEVSQLIYCSNSSTVKYNCRFVM